VAAFVATTSKSAMVALLLRYFYLSGAMREPCRIPGSSPPSRFFSMCAGNFLALRQTNVKRILAYSSIAHFGYILVAFLAGGTMAIEAVAFYLVAYTVNLLAAFGIVSVLSSFRAGCRQSGGLSRPLLAAAGDRRRIYRGAFVAGRHSRHYGLCGQVLYTRRGSERRRLAADRHPGGDQRRRPLLLPAHRRRSSASNRSTFIYRQLFTVTFLCDPLCPLW
jgi:hypothetical protein